MCFRIPESPKRFGNPAWSKYLCHSLTYWQIYPEDATDIWRGLWIKIGIYLYASTIAALRPPPTTMALASFGLHFRTVQRCNWQGENIPQGNGQELKWSWFIIGIPTWLSLLGHKLGFASASRTKSNKVRGNLKLIEIACGHQQLICIILFHIAIWCLNYATLHFFVYFQVFWWRSSCVALPKLVQRQVLRGARFIIFIPSWQSCSLECALQVPHIISKKRWNHGTKT